MNSLMSSTPSVSPFGTPFVSSFNMPFGTPFSSPYFSAAAGQIGSPLFNTSFNTPFNTSFNTPFSTPFSSTFNTPFSNPFSTPFGTPFISPINTPFGVQVGSFAPAPSFIGGQAGNGFSYPAPSNFASTPFGFSPFNTTFGFGGQPFGSFAFGQPQSDWGAMGGRFGGQPFGVPFNQAPAQFQPQFFGQSPWHFGGNFSPWNGVSDVSTTPWNSTPWNTPLNFGGFGAPNGFATPFGGNFASPLAGNGFSPWTGQFAQPSWNGFWQTTGLGQAQRSSTPVTTSGSTQTYATQPGFASPVNPITGNTPTQVPSPTLNQVGGGFGSICNTALPGFPPATFFGSVPTQLATGQFGSPFINQFGVQASGQFANPFTNQFTSQFGTPFASQFAPQFGTPFSGFGVEGSVTQDSTRGKSSGTTINVSQRDAA